MPRRTKQRRPIEIYEPYWNFTAAWTDIYGQKFNNALAIIISFIDRNIDEIRKMSGDSELFTDSQLYSELQDLLVDAIGFQGKDATLSARKGINLFVKIGFVKPFLCGYHSLAKRFLLERDRSKKQLLFTEIFYEASSIASGVTEDNTHLNHVAFFLRTLDENRKLTKPDVIALMVSNIDNYRKGYLSREELNSQYRFAVANNFEDRKYNQISHLISFLQKVVDLKYDSNNKVFWFADDPLVCDIDFDRTFPRDPVKQRIYKEKLKQLSRELFNGEVLCFFTQYPYTAMVASHIKPYKTCMIENREDEAFDPDNGLLLCLDVDAIFDKHKATFDESGYLICSRDVPNDIKEMYRGYKLDSRLLTPERQEYLKHHRQVFKEKYGV